MTEPCPLTAAEMSLIGTLRLPPDALNRALALRREYPDLRRALLESGAIGPHELLAALTAAGVAIQIGRYKLLREIARGAMGTVHLAFDHDLDRVVALKVLDNVQDVPRFEREARLAARLTHAHIIRIHEVGDSPCHYIAMAYIDGPTLEQAMPDLSQERKLALLIQIAEAVGHGHSKGVIHRDLKPANVLIDEFERAVVTDFGLARDYQTQDQTQLTATGSILGTLAYMSPEQVRGKTVGPTADVWALGVILYEMLMGERPFQVGRDQSIYEQILESDTDPPDAPQALQRIVSKALDKDPARRYADGAAFAKALHQFQQGGAVEHLPRHWPWIAATALLTLIAFGAWRRTRPTVVSKPRVQQPAPNDQPDLALQQEAERRRQELAAFRRLVVETRASFYVGRTDIRARITELTRALKLWDQTDRRKQDDVSALCGIGWYLTGQPGKAEPCLLEALRRNPEDGWVNQTLGRIQLERALAALLTNGQAEALPLTGRWSSKAMQYLGRGNQWPDERKIERHIARAYHALGRSRFTELRRLCQQGLARHRGPGTEEFWFLLGWLQPYKQRIVSWNKALALRPHYPWLSYARGMSRFHAGKLQLAAQDFEAVLRMHPRMAWGYLARGLVRQQLGDGLRALDDYTSAIALDHSLVLPYNNRGILYHNAGNFTAAVADFNQALRRDPRMAKAYNNRGLTYTAMGNPLRAIDDFTKAVRLEPSYVGAFLNRGVAHRAARQKKQAIADFGEVIRLDPTEKKALLNRGALYLELNPRRFKAALADFDRVLKLDPNYLKALYNRAVTRRAIRNYQGALTDFNRLIKLAPIAHNLAQRGMLLCLRLGQHERAIADFTRVIAADPNHVQAYSHRGISRRALKRLKPAIADFSRAIALNPRHANAYHNRATTRTELGDQIGAIADYTSALAINDQLASTYFDRGTAYRKCKQYRKAAADYRQTTILQPHWWNNWFHYAALLGTLQRFEEALAPLRKAEALAPPEARKSVRVLIRMMQDAIKKQKQ